MLWVFIVKYINDILWIVLSVSLNDKVASSVVDVKFLYFCFRKDFNKWWLSAKILSFNMRFFPQDIVYSLAWHHQTHAKIYLRPNTKMYSEISMHFKCSIWSFKIKFDLHPFLFSRKGEKRQCEKGGSKFNLQMILNLFHKTKTVTEHIECLFCWAAPYFRVEN